MHIVEKETHRIEPILLEIDCDKINSDRKLSVFDWTKLNKPDQIVEKNQKGQNHFDSVSVS